ncbi:MAG TPA: hypothetical protein VNX68_15605, partial [Nitrosopumilaceae archaeon]|nr:hypothetical protein [Nitrosopumilaceae archaeon]
MKFGLPAIHLLTILLFTIPAAAQSRQEDSIFYQSALTHTISLYFDQVGDQSRLFNGSLYPGFDLTFQTGSAYFLTDKATKGSVVYDNIPYPNLSIFYEDYRQYLVVMDQAYKLKLVNERVSSFTIAGHHFIYLFLDSLNRGIPSEGFYEILYTGRSKLLKYTSKKVREIISVSEGLRRYMDETNNYYIWRLNSFVVVNSKRELLNILYDHKKDMQRFIRKNDLDLKNDKDNALAQ